MSAQEHLESPAALSRRGFIGAASAAALAAALRLRAAPAPADDIVDIHQHCTYSGRPDVRIAIHQRNNGIATTVMQPAGTTGGCEAGIAGNAHTANYIAGQGAHYVMFANENAYRPGARQAIERYLQRGAIGIGELKDNVDCDSSYTRQIAEIARDHDVPMLMHFQEGIFNNGYTRFHRMLEQFPTVKFIGHAMTVWANIDKNFDPTQGLYPRGRVTPGGLTDRWLADYPNFYADLSAGSGNGALTRDVEFAKDMLTRHQDKILYGSDCNCSNGVGPICLGAVKQGLLKQLCATDEIRRKILSGNARKLLRLGAG